MKVPIRSGRFETEEVWYVSKDGTKIPMFIVSPKKIKRDGSNPTLLTGYGGFKIRQKTGFSPPKNPPLLGGGDPGLPRLQGGRGVGRGLRPGRGGGQETDSV